MRRHARPPRDRRDGSSIAREEARRAHGARPGRCRAPSSVGLSACTPGEQALASEVELEDETEHVGGALEGAALLLVVGGPRRPAVPGPAEEVDRHDPVPVDGIDETWWSGVEVLDIAVGDAESVGKQRYGAGA